MKSPAPAPRPQPQDIPARQPLFWAALAFSGGLWLGHIAWRPPTWWIVSASVFIATAIYFVRRRPRAARLLILGAFVFAGALAIQFPVSSGSSSTPVWFGDGQGVTVTAHVIPEGNLEEESPGAWRQRIDIETEQIASETWTQNVRAGVRVVVYSKSSARYDLGAETEIPAEAPQRLAGEVPGTRMFRYGERLRFTAKLITPRNYGNPGAFDYVGYLRDQGIAVTASVKASAVEPLAGFSGSRVGRALAGAHSSIIGRIHRLWRNDDSADRRHAHWGKVIY